MSNKTGELVAVNAVTPPGQTVAKVAVGVDDCGIAFMVATTVFVVAHNPSVPKTV